MVNKFLKFFLCVPAVVAVGLLVMAGAADCQANEKAAPSDLKITHC